MAAKNSPPSYSYYRAESSTTTFYFRLNKKREQKLNLDTLQNVFDLTVSPVTPEEIPRENTIVYTMAGGIMADRLEGEQRARIETIPLGEVLRFIASFPTEQLRRPPPTNRSSTDADWQLVIPLSTNPLQTSNNFSETIINALNSLVDSGYIQDWSGFSIECETYGRILVMFTLHTHNFQHRPEISSALATRIPGYFSLRDQGRHLPLESLDDTGTELCLALVKNDQERAEQILRSNGMNEMFDQHQSERNALLPGGQDHASEAVEPNDMNDGNILSLRDQDVSEHHHPSPFLSLYGYKKKKECRDRS